MDGQPTEEFSSIEPNERQQIGTDLPSFELLNEIMEGPRKRAEYFSLTIAERYPTGSLDETKEKTSQQVARTITGQLESYQKHWLSRHLATVKDEYQSLVTSSPEILPQKSELSFHIINQFIMPQWHRVLVSPKYPKMDTMDLETAQIRLAIESASLLPAKNTANQAEVLNHERRDIDAMITLLQLSIDGELQNQPGLVTLPHPEMGNVSSPADFLIFEPTYDGTFNKVEVTSAQVLDPSLAPGMVAIELLNNLRINSISRRPEFQDKVAFHKLLLAHQKARLYYQKPTELF